MDQVSPALDAPSGVRTAGVAPGRALWAATSLLVVVVLPLAVLVELRWSPVLRLDADLSESVVRPGTGTDVDLLQVVTHGGDFRLRLLVTLPLVLWLIVRRRWRAPLFAAAGLLLISPVNGLVKRIVERPRPTYPDVESISGTSYPSGHSSGSAALATVLIILFWPLLRRRGHLLMIIVGAAVMIMVGGSRVLLGVHYPFDVVAGWSLGVAWVIMLALLLRVWPGEVGALRGRSTSPAQPTVTS